MDQALKKQKKRAKRLTPAVVVYEEKISKPLKNPAQELLNEVKRDMGKVALFVSSMAVVLMVLFYFTLKYTMLKTEAKVNNITKQIQIFDKKIAELEKLPQKTRNIIYFNLMEDISEKAKFLSTKLTGERKQKLLEAQKLIKEAQKGLDK